MSELIVEMKSRRGKSLHVKNPFLKDAIANTKQGGRKISNTDGRRMMVVSEATGEVAGPAGFWQYEEVDRTKFVKLYVNGVKQFKELSNAGTKVFEILYLEVTRNIGKDKIYLSFGGLDHNQTPMSEATFNRGMKELVEKNFVAATTAVGWYWLNPDYIWNGDRLAFVKTYQIKPIAKGKSQIDDKTIDMFEGAMTESSQG